jgi:threonine dehydrogenase-like Zn-dependent dehydrogenase
MDAKWAALKGASHLIIIDNVDWRLEHLVRVIKKDHPDLRIDIINFNEHKQVQSRIAELTKPGVDGRDPTRPVGVDVALEAAAGEYAKSWAHKLEITVGLETDTSEILNECITSTIAYGTVGITGVYAGYTNHCKSKLPPLSALGPALTARHPPLCHPLRSLQSTSDQSCSAESGSLETAKRRPISGWKR